MSTVLLKNQKQSHNDDQLQIKEGNKEKSIKGHTKHEKKLYFKTEIFKQSVMQEIPFGNENEDIFIQEDIIKNTRFLPKNNIKNKNIIFMTNKILKETKRP
jgi:hypothetical protein